MMEWENNVTCAFLPSLLENDTTVEHPKTSVFTGSLLSFFFPIIICLSNCLFFPFILFFPTTLCSDPFPPCLSLSSLFSHYPSCCLFMSPLIFRLSYAIYLFVKLFSNFPVLFTIFLLLRPSPPPSLHPCRRWSGGCQHGEPALEAGAGQSLWTMTP